MSSLGAFGIEGKQAARKVGADLSNDNYDDMSNDNDALAAAGWEVCRTAREISTTTARSRGKLRFFGRVPPGKAPCETLSNCSKVYIIFMVEITKSSPEAHTAI